MRIVGAIFQKQLDDVLKNPMVTSVFILFPILTWVMVRFQSTGEPGEAFLIMMTIAMMSVASMPITAVTTYIAEDVEKHSLRFLIMAGVKPMQYLAGLASFSLVLSLLSMVAFAFIGEVPAHQIAMFLGITMIGCITSLIIGAVLGILSKNVQQSSIYVTVFGLALGFIPILSMMNPEIFSRTFFLYTQQVFVSLMYLALGGGQYAIDQIYTNTGYSFSILSSVLMIAGNILVAMVLFVVLYKKKGLR